MIYDFTCPTCGGKLELTMTVAEYEEVGPEPECLHCGTLMRRVWNARVDKASQQKGNYNSGGS
jgi:uncharacterized Zn finger protein